MVKEDKLFSKYFSVLDEMETIKYCGSVTKISELIIESEGPQVRIGEVCEVSSAISGECFLCEVVGLHNTKVQLMPYENIAHLEIGSSVRALSKVSSIPVSHNLLGRVIDSQGRPIDGKGPIVASENYPLTAAPPNVLTRKRIKDPILTGVKAIDFFTPIAKGQRMGLFAGSGVGKSTLLGMIAKNTDSDINVIALIGERGREVKEFIEDILGPEGMKKSVVIVSSSADTPLSRVRGAFAATSVAEYFSHNGKDVMLFFDSVTRFAMAQREIGLSSGEVASSRGYTPSVFTLLPRLLERCGTSENGTITGIYTVLVEGDDFDEPITDSVRAIIDGHIILSRKLAEQEHYPPIDICNSLSRLEKDVSSKNHSRAASKLRKLVSVYNEEVDYINMGAYSPGSNSTVDEAISKIDDINGFLHQKVDEVFSFEELKNLAYDISGLELINEEV